MITVRTRAARAMAARVSARALITALIGLTLACGDDSSVGPAGTSAPADDSLTATATSDASDAPTGATVDLADLTPISIVYGAGEGDLPSDQPALASGDFDGDGLTDLAIGARFADPQEGVDAGSVYVVFGAPELTASVDLAQGEQGLTISGPHAGAGFGFSAVAADLNGDGDDDLAIGAPFTRRGQIKTGVVYVFFGPLPDEGSQLVATEADLVLNGESNNGFFGDSLAAGDVSADGVADLVVGATFDSHSSGGRLVRSGAVYAFLGRAEWPEALFSSDADASILGEDSLDELGDFVTTGDVNGDGTEDVIITAEAADGPENERTTAAQVYIVLGRDDFSGTYELARGEADTVIFGAKTRDTLGFSLATGDLDGDGIAELAMGARLADGGGVSRAGVVYVLSGGDLPAEIDLAEPPESVRAVHGAAAGDLLGISLRIGDVDGDGTSELLAGARLAGPEDRARAGVLYAIHGLPPEGITNVAVAASLTVVGEDANDALGGNLLIADLDGDGRPELVVVAENASGPDGRPGVGRVYIISGL